MGLLYRIPSRGFRHSSAAHSEGCFNLFVRRTLSGSDGSPAGFDFLAQKVVVISGFALSSHILAEQFTGDLGRWLVRCIGFGNELVTQLDF
jgi:hypothetical protein